MSDIRTLIKEEVLEKARFMSLATHDDGGVWVADVIFIFDDDLNIYWLSETKTRHSQAIIKNPNVAATITLTSKAGEPNIGIQFAGTAEKLEGDNEL